MAMNLIFLLEIKKTPTKQTNQPTKKKQRNKTKKQTTKNQKMTCWQKKLMKISLILPSMAFSFHCKHYLVFILSLRLLEQGIYLTSILWNKI